MLRGHEIKSHLGDPHNANMTGMYDFRRSLTHKLDAYCARESEGRTCFRTHTHSLPDQVKWRHMNAHFGIKPGLSLSVPFTSQNALKCLEIQSELDLAKYWLSILLLNLKTRGQTNPNFNFAKIQSISNMSSLVTSVTLFRPSLLEQFSLTLQFELPALNYILPR